AAGARADGEAERCLSVAADLGHPADVLLEGEGDAGPRGDPMDGYLEPVRLGEHRLQAPGPFHAGDLDPVVAAVGERLARLGDRSLVLRVSERPEETARDLLTRSRRAVGYQGSSPPSV